MRNLLGRLNARGADDLNRIASAWLIHLASQDRIANVAQLYRAMTDVRTIRDLWERLPEDERALILLLAEGDEKQLPVPELAARLNEDPSLVRQTAISLYRKGIIAREGDDLELPVGELPRLFLPRELAGLFHRVHAEIARGDVSGESLTGLLARIDDRDLEDAATAWGIRVIPGLRSREEITQQLLGAIAEHGRRDAVLRQLSRQALAIWGRLLEEPTGRPLPIETAAAAANFAGDDARSVTGRRRALSALEDALLVWHSYGPEGERLLFVPADIRSPGAQLVQEVKPPSPIAAEPDASVAFDVHALAWDLLTLIRALAPPASVKLTDAGEMPKAIQRQLNGRLWVRGKETPPAGYVAFLLELAETLELVAGGDPATGEALIVTAQMRTWRDRGFPDQAARLRGAWLAADSWSEGEAREAVDVSGADWPGYRLKLLAHLGGLAPDRWYGLEEVSAWIAQRDPSMLGATFTAATARSSGVADDDLHGRRLIIAEVTAVTLDTACHWFGLVDRASGPQRKPLVRLTAAGAAIARGHAAPEPAIGAGAPLVAEPPARLVLHAPTPLRVWSLSAFADQQELGPPAVFQLGEASIQRALAAGFTVGQIGQFLAKQLGVPPPADMLAAIDGWGHGFKHARVQQGVIVTPGDASQLDGVMAAARAAGLGAEAIGGRVLVYADSREAAELLRALRVAGFSVQTDMAEGGREKRPAT